MSLDQSVLFKATDEPVRFRIASSHSQWPHGLEYPMANQLRPKLPSSQSAASNAERPTCFFSGHVGYRRSTGVDVTAISLEFLPFSLCFCGAGRRRVNFRGAGGRSRDGRGQGGEKARERWGKGGVRGGVLLKLLKGGLIFFFLYHSFRLYFEHFLRSSIWLKKVILFMSFGSEEGETSGNMRERKNRFLFRTAFQPFTKTIRGKILKSNHWL